MKDRFNREINYLRISVTDNCNYNCRYCKPDTKEAYHPDKVTDEEILKIVQTGSLMGINKIRLTGGEPLVRKGILNLIKNIKAIPGINEVVLTTNGSLLINQLEALKEAGLDRVNLSLDSLDAQKFKYITKGGNLDDVLRSIDLLLTYNMKPVKINVVLMKGFNDDEILDFVNLTKEKEVSVRFIELMPIGEHDITFETHFLSNKEVLKQSPELIPLSRTGSETASYFKLPNAKGKVGLISAISNHFCSACNRLRITSDGKIKTCLHEDVEYDLLSYMRKNDGELRDYLAECIEKKPKSHKINKADFEKVKKNMYQIGG